MHDSKKRSSTTHTDFFFKTSFKVLDNQSSMTFAYCCCFHYVLFVGGPLFLQQGYSAESSRGSSLDENSGQATNLCSSSLSERLVYIMKAIWNDQITIKACEPHSGGTLFSYLFIQWQKTSGSGNGSFVKSRLLRTLRRRWHAGRRDADLCRDEFSGMQSGGGGGGGGTAISPRIDGQQLHA